MLLSIAWRRKLLVVLTALYTISLVTSTLGSEPCPSYQFKCRNGRCVPLSWHCDEDNDCGDNSDEAHCHNRTCSKSEFKCNNSRCVPLKWQCDREDDCGDGSDEDPSLCKTKECSVIEFSCKSQRGICIPLTWRCDGVKDCSDGSDEDDCQVPTCSDEEFTCSNRKCITSRWVCDQDNDCEDGSDERNCSNVTCSATDFTCLSGKCIPDRWRCDGDMDCVDHSDEENCPTKEVRPVCSAREFTCANMQDCIHIAWVCDGENDCPDGSDEFNCTVTCRPDQFHCLDNHCIAGPLQCNGVADCADGSDEKNCTAMTKERCDLEVQFDCGKNHCIPMDLVCNNKNDCGEWEDEPRDKCHKNECLFNNGGCSQLCIDRPVGFQCGCRPGFHLVDERTCEDVNECEVPGTCSQVCINLKGGFKCECMVGYHVEPSHPHSCRAASPEHTALMFANRHDLRRYQLDSGELRAVVSGLHSAVSFDYHYHRDLIVWTDTNLEAIKSAPLSRGSPVSTLAVDRVSTPDGIAVDWVYDHIYWTDTGTNTIEVADLHGNMRRTLIQVGLDEPRAIALNPLEGWMFWSDWGEPAMIERAGMDGSHRSAIISSDIRWPNGVTLDLVTRKIYWVDAKLHLLECADFNGNNRHVVLSSPTLLRHPFSIDVFEDWVFWSDWEQEAIHKANKFTGGNVSAVVQGTYSPMDLHIFHSYKQPRGVNQCGPLNGHCSHLCLPAPVLTEFSARFQCACPDTLDLAADHRTCVPRNITSSTSSTTTTPLPPYLIPVPSNSSGDKAISSSMEAIPQAEEVTTAVDNNSSTGTIIGVLSGLLAICALVAFLVYRQYLRRNVTSMNFDNPVYRKTTEEDHFTLEKNLYQPGKPIPPSLEPLTSPSTNDFV